MDTTGHIKVLLPINTTYDLSQASYDANVSPLLSRTDYPERRPHGFGDLSARLKLFGSVRLWRILAIRVEL